MTYRNRAFLDLCHEAPCLLLPGQHECLGASSEPCHSDMIRHGRGEHHKSHDCFAVPGCHNAHLAFTRSNLGKEGYHAAWTEAMERYILWQWVSGKVRLADITQRPKESTMEAPHCRICDHKHWAREPHILPADAPAEKRSVKKVHAARVSEILFPPGSQALFENKPSPAPPRSPRRDGDMNDTVKKKSSSGLNVHVSSVSLAREASNSALTAGVTARRDGKNTPREGRRVLKAEGDGPDATRTAGTPRPDPPPATPGKFAGKNRQSRAAKPSPGKRKPRTKDNKRKGNP